MATELSIYDKVDDPLTFSEKAGALMAKSGMLGLPNVEAGFVVAFTCACERITPIQFSRRYHIINGKPTMRADAMLAEAVMNHGAKFRVVEKSPDRAAIELTRDGNATLFELTWDQARDEKWPYTRDKGGNPILKDNWATARGRQSMLWARVISDAVRTTFPEVNAGVYSPEEMSDAGGVLIQDPTTVPEPAVDADVPSLAVPAAQPPAAEVTTSVMVAPDQPMVRTPVPEPVVTEELASDQQRMQIELMFAEGKVALNDRRKVLAKRGCESIDQLTRSQADELIGKMQARLKNS